MRNFIITIFLSTIFLQANTIEDKQLEILKKMTNDSIDDAYKPLLDLLKRKNINISKPLMKKASLVGNAQALRLLGYQKLTKHQDSKGLILLCKAAVIGDSISRKDLFLMPYILPITKKQINFSFEKAINSLKQDEKIQVNKPLKEKIDLFESEKKSKSRTYHGYLRYLSKNIKLYSRDNFDQYLKKKDAKDLNKLNNQNIEVIQNSSKDISELINIDMADDQVKLKEKIKQQLIVINQHRTSEKKISLEELWKIVQENK